MTIACIVGARPNFMKMAPILAGIRQRPSLQAFLIHTGQHNSPEMSEHFFRDLEMPPPDEHLGIGTATPIVQTAEIMRRLEPVFMKRQPELVLVAGDVNSTMASAITAAKIGLPLAHVEAGLRSFDRRMPEEINRLVTDALSDLLFVSEPSGVKNLRAEGVPESRIFFVGNVMIDTLLRFRQKAESSSILANLGLTPKQYVVATLHRPSNVDDVEQLGALCSMLEDLSKTLPVVFPVHPRTRQRLASLPATLETLRLIGPQSYLDFLRLISETRLVLTDSGGIQEETTILQVPCLTMRENTERPITVERGSNRLVGTVPTAILSAAREVLEEPPRVFDVPELWDGQASGRILDVLENWKSSRDGRGLHRNPGLPQ
jgi:UDP-N-acetylglucosamine 2-epimerase (non-hydrolysing)